MVRELPSLIVDTLTQALLIQSIPLYTLNCQSICLLDHSAHSYTRDSDAEISGRHYYYPYHRR